MVPLKPREIRNFLLSQNFPFGFMVRVCIMRILEEIRAIPTRTVENHLTNWTSYTSVRDSIDAFLEDECGFPSYILKNLHDSCKEKSFHPPSYQLDNFIQKLNSSDFSSYFFDLQNDFLGKLNEYQESETKGVVYTPKSIIDHMSNYILGIFIDSESSNPTILESSTVLDPACGSGPFLVKIFDILCDKLLEYEEKTSKWSEIPKKAVCCCYGVDVDEYAVIFTRINLWLASIKFFTIHQLEFSLSSITPRLFSILENHIVIGDSLLYIPVDLDVWKKYSINLDEIIGKTILSDEQDSILDRFIEKYFPTLSKKENFHGFDIIIGNPPYISSKDLPYEYKELLRELYITAIHQFDLYSIFIELSMSLLGSKGLFAYIIPESYLGRSSFAENRKLLLNSTKILRIENIQQVFLKKSVSNCILFFQNMHDLQNTFHFVQYNNKGDFVDDCGCCEEIPQLYCLGLENFKILCHASGIRDIINKIHTHATQLGTSIKIHRGEEIGKKSEVILDNAKSNTRKIASGENVKKFLIDEAGNYIRINDIKKQNVFYSKPKILVRQLGNHIQAAYDDKGEFVTIQTVYNIISTRDDLSLEFILGLLNSELVQFYYEVIFKEKQIFPRILLENILQIPLVKPNQKSQLIFKNVVKKVITSVKSDKNPDVFISELNNRIYNLYSIDEKEKKIIQSYLNP